MRPLFNTSTVPHAWRQVWALIAAAVWWSLLLYVLIVAAARLLGPMPYMGPVAG